MTREPTDGEDRDADAWLALDIGGANIKAAHEAGGARTLPFELWKRPEELPRVVAEIAAAFPPTAAVAITMTGELCDCFPSREAGVRAIVQQAQGALAPAAIWVWGVDQRLHPPAVIRKQPALAAAANWLALAALAARLVPNGPGLLIDIGSTTTDLIPLCDGKGVPRGLTDTERLRSGELVYAGVVRTPVCALASELVWKGGPIGLAAELFASTLDLYLLLGRIEPEPSNRSTADGRPRTLDAARGRLARMIGSDRDELTLDDARELARCAHQALLDRLVAASERACRVIGRPAAAVAGGSGAFLAAQLAQAVIEPGGPIIELQNAWGHAASDAACAYALARLAREQLGPASEARQ